MARNNGGGSNTRNTRGSGGGDLERIYAFTNEIKSNKNPDFVSGLVLKLDSEAVEKMIAQLSELQGSATGVTLFLNTFENTSKNNKQYLSTSISVTETEENSGGGSYQTAGDKRAAQRSRVRDEVNNVSRRQ